MAGPIVKGILRTAGTALGSYLDEALSIGGKVGQKAATAALDAGKGFFAPSLVGASAADTPELLRSGARSVIPRAGKLIGQGATIGGALYLGSLADSRQIILNLWLRVWTLFYKVKHCRIKNLCMK